MECDVFTENKTTTKKYSYAGVHWNPSYRFSCFALPYVGRLSGLAVSALCLTRRSMVQVRLEGPTSPPKCGNGYPDPFGVAEEKAAGCGTDHVNLECVGRSRKYY